MCFLSENCKNLFGGHDMGYALMIYIYILMYYTYNDAFEIVLPADQTGFGVKALLCPEMVLKQLVRLMIATSGIWCNLSPP